MRGVTLASLFILLMFIWVNNGNFFLEQQEKEIVQRYYQALMDEDYERSFESLYLYDTSGGKPPVEGTSLNNAVTKDLYLTKIERLKEHDYKVVGFEIEKVKYEDGHTSFLEIEVETDVFGKRHFWSETIDIWEGKVWIVDSNDPLAKYRNGDMGVKLE